MTKWEYKVLDELDSGVVDENDLNSLGDNGWELVSVVPVQLHFRYFFRRLVEPKGKRRDL